jgi:hypothetical protein
MPKRGSTGSLDDHERVVNEGFWPKLTRSLGRLQALFGLGTRGRRRRPGPREGIRQAACRGHCARSAVTVMNWQVMSTLSVTMLGIRASDP